MSNGNPGDGKHGDSNPGKDNPGDGKLGTSERDPAIEASRAAVITEGFKGLMIANGGGAAALLAFVQATWNTAPNLARLALLGIAITSFGFAVALLVPMFRYFHARAAEKLELAAREQNIKLVDRRTPWWYLYWLCMYASVAIFTAAVGVLVWNGLGLLQSPERADKQRAAVKNAVWSHWAAVNQGDFGSMASQHTNGLTVILADVEGAFDAKSKQFEELWNRKAKGQLRDLRIEFLDDAVAVATFHIDAPQAISVNGVDRNERRVTEVWISEGGSWKQAHHHDSFSIARAPRAADGKAVTR